MDWSGVVVLETLIGKEIAESDPLFDRFDPFRQKCGADHKPIALDLVPYVSRQHGIAEDRSGLAPQNITGAGGFVEYCLAFAFAAFAVQALRDEAMHGSDANRLRGTHKSVTHR